MGDGSDKNRRVQGPVDESGTGTEGLQGQTPDANRDEPWVLQRNDEIWFSTASIESDQERSETEELIGEMVRSGLDQPMLNLQSVEYSADDIEPFFPGYSDSDVWVAANTVITKDAWNDAWQRYQSRFNTSINDLLKKLRQYDDMTASLPPRGNVQYFVEPKRSGKRQFISRFDEWLHHHEAVDLDRLQDPEYLKLLKETTLEQISDGFDDRRDMGLWSRWSDDYKAESCYWDFKHPVYFTRNVERSDLGVVGGDCNG